MLLEQRQRRQEGVQTPKKLPLLLPDSDSISYIQSNEDHSLWSMLKKKRETGHFLGKKSPFCPPQHFVLLVRVKKKKNIFLVRGGKEMVSGLNKFISSLNETSNVEKFCLSPWDECMFQPHIKLH